MNPGKLLKGFSTAGAALALSLSLSSAASAAPAFEVTPSVLGGPATSFQADQIGGFSSSLLTYDGLNTVTGTGYVAFTGFALNDAPVLGTGLNNDYTLWVTYDYTTNVVGVFGAPNTQNTVTSLTFTVWGAAGTGTVFNAANASTNTAPSVVGAGVAIGGGTLVQGVAGFDELGGAYFNSITTYANTAFGNTFFTAPVPFYDLAFESFNNTTQGIQRVGNVVAVNQAIGNVDFNRVPEPVSLALLGVGLVGMGFATRRRKH